MDLIMEEKYASTKCQYPSFQTNMLTNLIKCYQMINLSATAQGLTVGLEIQSFTWHFSHFKNGYSN